MIQILDNFFDQKDFEILQNYASSNISYEPRYFKGTKEKTDENTYGFRHEIASNKQLVAKFLNQIEKKYNITVKSFGTDSGIDKRKLTLFKPHTDTGKLNFFLMIIGPQSLNNGLCIYTNNSIDTHIGFLENRAVLFPSNILHTPSVSEDKKTWRTIATIFIHDYEYKITKTDIR